MSPTDDNRKRGPRMLVVHGTPLVAEDLHDALVSAGAAEVELAPTLPDTAPERAFDVCFLSLPASSPPDGALLERATRIAAHVVLIVSFQHARPAVPPRVSFLSEPFREEDVHAAMLCVMKGLRQPPDDGTAA